MLTRDILFGMNILTLVGLITLGSLGACTFPQTTTQQQARHEQVVQTIMGQVRGMILQSGPGW